jgi:hypothetical protein
MPPRNTLPPNTCVCGKLNCPIPFGRCHCGCGRETALAKINRYDRGIHQGMPVKYIHGHTGGYERYVRLPDGLCICRDPRCAVRQSALR